MIKTIAVDVALVAGDAFFAAWAVSPWGFQTVLKNVRV